jgi:hypothetical protein
MRRRCAPWTCECVLLLLGAILNILPHHKAFASEAGAQLCIDVARGRHLQMPVIQRSGMVALQVRGGIPQMLLHTLCMLSPFLVLPQLW